MLVKGIVMSQMTQDSNTIKVRLPTYESAGIDAKVIINALIAYNPGNLYSYNIGDVVVVSFEHNQVDQPIVLGKLYIGPEEKASNYSFANSLQVTEKAILPTTTTIGNLSYNDLVLAVNSAANSEVKADVSDTPTSVTPSSSSRTNKCIRMIYEAGYLTVYLHNFEETDAGKTIWLYKTSRHSKKGYKHPDALGYGLMAGQTTGHTYYDEQTQSYISATFPAVPSWMDPDETSVSWDITTAMIQTGYFVIDIKKDWICLAGYSFTDEDWTQIFGCSDFSSMHELSTYKHNGCMRIKFGLVDTKKNLELLSSDTLYFGKNASCDPGELVYINSGLTKCLNLSALYITVK